MIINLFSRFNPTSSFRLPLNWLSSVLIFLFIPLTMWVSQSRFSFIWKSLLNFSKNEFKALLTKSHIKVTIIFVSLFIIIILNNFIGLFPYTFTASSHLSFTLSLGLVLWTSYILYGFIFNIKHILTHLVPQGTPVYLIPLIVIIERIRNIIRPGTLAVRLAANIIAGHLLIILIRRNGPNLTFVSGILLILAQTLLVTLECAVSLIQAYVFAVLRILYVREIIYDKF